MSEKNNDWTLIAVILGVLMIIGSQCSGPSDGCYDADPTQWVEMVCPGE